MEIELRGWHHKRDCEGLSNDPNYSKGDTRESSYCSSLCRLRDRSHETIGCHHDSPHWDRHGHHNATLDAMSQALRRATDHLSLMK